MKLIAVAALAGGLIAAPLTGLGSGAATASPSTCDGVDCVPYVKRGVQAGERCNQSTLFNFGLDPSGATMVCNSKSMWISWMPLVGVRTLRSACSEPGTAAQAPGGHMLACTDGAWTADNSATFFR